MSNTKQQIQQELKILGAVTNELRRLDDALIARLKTEQAAMRFCMSRSKVKYTDEEYAKQLGMSRGHFNTIINSDHSDRVRNMSRVNQELLQLICQNTAIDQWASLCRRGLLDHQRSHEQQLSDAHEEVARLEEMRGAA